MIQGEEPKSGGLDSRMDSGNGASKKGKVRL